MFFCFKAHRDFCQKWPPSFHSSKESMKRFLRVSLSKFLLSQPKSSASQCSGLVQFSDYCLSYWVIWYKSLLVGLVVLGLYHVFCHFLVMEIIVCCSVGGFGRVFFFLESSTGSYFVFRLGQILSDVLVVRPHTSLWRSSLLSRFLKKIKYFTHFSCFSC